MFSQWCASRDGCHMVLNAWEISCLHYSVGEVGIHRNAERRRPSESRAPHTEALLQRSNYSSFAYKTLRTLLVFSVLHVVDLRLMMSSTPWNDRSSLLKAYTLPILVFLPSTNFRGHCERSITDTLRLCMDKQDEVYLSSLK